MSDREEVSEDRLIEELNQRLALYPHCSDCEFVGPIRKADDPYGDGGNWLRQLTVRGRPADPQAVGSTAADVVTQVASAFNLK